MLETLLHNESLVSMRVHADRIMKGLRFFGPAKLNNAILLIKEGASRSMALDTNQDIRQTARTIIDSADLNESLFELFGSTASRRDIREMEINVVSRLLRVTDYFGYLITRSIALDEVETYLEDVERTFATSDANG